MSAGLILQWVIVAAILGWALWFVGSRLGLFTFVMSSKRQPRAGAKCTGCEHCGPATGMQKMLDQIDEKSSSRM